MRLGPAGATSMPTPGHLLRPRGWLGLMTGLLADEIDFSAWHDLRDPTHVVFYQPATLRYLSDQHGWTCEFPAQDVALMHKPAL
jgi:hypothetical protein